MAYHRHLWRPEAVAAQGRRTGARLTYRCLDCGATSGRRPAVGWVRYARHVRLRLLVFVVAVVGALAALNGATLRP